MDYDYIKHYFNIYEQDISSLKKYLAPYLDTKKDVINCYFRELQFWGGYYNGSIQYEEALGAGVHEYVHYLTFTSKFEVEVPIWMSDGIAEYCANYLEKEYYDNNNDYLIEHLYNKNLAAINGKTNKSYLKFYYEFVAYLNNKMNATIKWNFA